MVLPTAAYGTRFRSFEIAGPVARTPPQDASIHSYLEAGMTLAVAF